MPEKNAIKFPERVRKRKAIRYWLEYLGESEPEMPLVVEEEHYTRQSVMKKLGPDRDYGVNRNLVIALIREGLIKSGNFHKLENHSQPVSNLSLARTISRAFNKPLEEILFSEEYFSSEEFQKKNPRERVRALFNAYTGAKWFEIFKGRFNSGNNLKIFASQNIRLNDLHELLNTAPYEPGDKRRNLVRLVDKGFIIPTPTNRKFKPFSSRNFVHPEGLTELISRLSGLKTREIIVRTDSYFDGLVESYLQNRLLPYLLDRSINPEQRYSPQQAAQFLGIQTHVLTERLKKKVLKDINSKSKKTHLRGVDIAIYALKETNRQIFLESEIANLFGLSAINPEQLGFHASANQTYSRHHYVFPLYDRVAKKAKRTLIKMLCSELGYKFNHNSSLTYEEIVARDREMQSKLDKRALS